jgi:hypothetical protein
MSQNTKLPMMASYVRFVAEFGRRFGIDVDNRIGRRRRGNPTNLFVED